MTRGSLYYRKVIITAIEAFLKVHSIIHGTLLETDRIYAEGHLAVYKADVAMDFAVSAFMKTFVFV